MYTRPSGFARSLVEFVVGDVGIGQVGQRVGRHIVGLPEGWRVGISDLVVQRVQQIGHRLLQILVQTEVQQHKQGLVLVHEFVFLSFFDPLLDSLGAFDDRIDCVLRQPRLEWLLMGLLEMEVGDERRHPIAADLTFSTDVVLQGMVPAVAGPDL